mgnify:CR=1 FL=1
MRENRLKIRKLNIFLVILALACLLAAGGCGSTSQIESTVDEVRKKLIGDNTLVVDSISEDKYAYQTLNEEAKKVYDTIVYTIMNRESDVQIATTDVKTMELAYQAVRYDYCEFFWVDQLNYVTYTRDNEITAIEISPTYTMTESEQKKTQEQIDQEVERILAEAPADGSDFDRALYVYETLINEVDYVENSENNQNIISVFINHETICQGYAYATQYLLERLGIPCTTVTGNARGESHAWNLVQVDGDYYYVDTTWGDASYRMENGSEQRSLPEINYDYLCVTTEDLLRTHRIEAVIPMPECTATEANYYVREGSYFTSYDHEQMQAVFDRAIEGGRTEVTIKCADELCYQEICHALIDEQEIFSYMQIQGNSNTVTYAQNGKQLSLTFWVTNE